MSGGVVVVLASDVSSTGGIQRVVRGVVDEIARAGGIDAVRLVTVHPEPAGRFAGVPVRSARPSRQQQERVPLLRQVGYVKLVLIEVWKVRREVEAIVCLHAGLAAVAQAAARLGRVRYSVAAYGVEVWGKLPLWDRAALRAAHSVWSISDFTSAQLRHRHGIPAHKIRHWVIGLDAIPEAARRTPSTKLTVLTVARLTRRNAYKGVDTLLMAWPHLQRQFPGARLEVIGDGDNMSHLRRLTMLLGIERQVSFLGRVSDAERDAAYARADVFALPGRASLGRCADGEGLGLVFLEAQAVGIPVVVGRAGGAPEALIDGETGVLVDPDDVFDVARGIASLLGDDERRRRMGRLAREWVLDKRSPEAARVSLHALLRQLAGSA